MTDRSHPQQAPQTALDSIEATVQAAIKEQPLLAMGAVLGFGLLVGFAMTKPARPPRRLKNLQNWAGTDIRSRDFERAIDRMENVVSRNVPHSMDQVRQSVAGLPEMVGALLQAWQTKAASKFDDVKSAMPNVPNVTDIKAAVSDTARKWAK